jgi:hypothetical protein
MEFHVDVDSGVAEYIEETGLVNQLSSFLSQVIQVPVFSGDFPRIFLQGLR